MASSPQFQRLEPQTAITVPGDAGLPRIGTFCPVCGRITQHTQYFSLPIAWSDRDIGIFGSDHYHLLCCKGCQNILIRHETTFSEDIDERGRPEVSYRELSLGSAGRSACDAASDLPSGVRTVYVEVLKAVNLEMTLLAAVGLRTLVEALCIERRCSGPNLASKIDGLVNSGALSPDQASFLHELRFLGNDAAHEIDAPPVSEVICALDIIESVLQTVYQLPKKAAEIRTSRSKRTRAARIPAKTQAPAPPPRD